MFAQVVEVDAAVQGFRSRGDRVHSVADRRPLLERRHDRIPWIVPRGRWRCGSRPRASAAAPAARRVWKTFGTVAANQTFASDFDALDDVDRDGVVDLVVGTPGETASFQSEGSVTLLSGRNGSTIWKSYGGLTNAALGRTVRKMSDLDGDRIRDFLAWYQDIAANQFVVTTDTRMTGSVPGAPLTERVHTGRANAGDVNGDGLDDVVTDRSDRVAVLSGRFGTEGWTCRSAAASRRVHERRRRRRRDGDGS